MERLQAELQRERQRSEAARERYEAMSSRSGQQRSDGGAARGDQQKAADGRRFTGPRDSKVCSIRSLWRPYSLHDPIECTIVVAEN